MAKVVNYLSNKNLLVQFEISNQRDQMSDELAKMCMLIVERYAKKPNFASYTYREDFEAYAIMQLVRTWRGFDCTKSQNPFAWITSCVHNSFLQFLNKEKDQRNIRDALLINVGLNPSHNYSGTDNEVENIRALDF